LQPCRSRQHALERRPGDQRKNSHLQPVEHPAKERCRQDHPLGPSAEARRRACNRGRSIRDHYARNCERKILQQATRTTKPRSTAHQPNCRKRPKELRRNVARSLEQAQLAVGLAQTAAQTEAEILKQLCF